MSTNTSVEKFKRDLAKIAPSVQLETMVEVQKQAERLADMMRSVVNVKSGLLRNSIRIAPGPNKVSLLVVAGGPTTTKSVGKAKSGGAKYQYDYARAQEFGTTSDPSQPFFWPSYRLLKRPIKSALARASRKGIERIMKLTNA